MCLARLAKGKVADEFRPEFGAGIPPSGGPAPLVLTAGWLG